MKGKNMTLKKIFYIMGLIFLSVINQAKAERVYHCPNPYDYVKSIEEYRQNHLGNFLDKYKLKNQEEVEFFDEAHNEPKSSDNISLSFIDFTNISMLHKRSSMSCDFIGQTINGRFGVSNLHFIGNVPETGDKCYVAHDVNLKGENQSQRETVNSNEIPNKCKSWDECYVVCN